MPRIDRVLVALGLILAGACAPTDRGSPEDAGPASAEAPDRFDELLERIPAEEVPALDREMALTLAAMPLSCLDRPHAEGENRRAYLDTLVTTRVPGYVRNRAFYGCWDWHSAVNSTWAMIRLYEEFPDLPVGGLIEEKLSDHLSEEALAGEVEFFDGNRTFERPYGYAWLLRLYAELRGWDHPDAAEWANAVEPLATMFSERVVEWLADLKIPSRVGVHGNTAFALAMMLDAARELQDRSLTSAIEEASVRLFGDDFGCPTAYEPWGSDFLSPCLEEAALMAQVLGDGYVAWLDDFLPDPASREFRPLLGPTSPEEVVSDFEEGGPSDRGSTVDSVSADETADRRAEDETRALASASHLIGLAFIRADAMNRIVAALPADDARVPVLRRLARVHGARGFDAMFDADYAGSHWIGTFAVKYLLTERSPASP